MTPTISSAVPRLLRRKVAQQWVQEHDWSLAALFSNIAVAENRTSVAAVSFSVKCSTTSRFFMYEEHQAGTKLEDELGATQTMNLSSAAALVDLFHDTSGQAYYYWTSPIQAFAPQLLTTHLKGYETLYNDNDNNNDNKVQNQKEDNILLDPRGPSVWLGNSGSATQAHYDVADNVVVQLHGTKRVRCYPPSAFLHLYVFPDAHPRARKSQVNFDEMEHNHSIMSSSSTSSSFKKNDTPTNNNPFPFFDTLPLPVIDVVLHPGDALAIPAFWFHHVENGRLPNYTTTTTTATPTTTTTTIDGPSVSLNLFALSKSMMLAQQIFQAASRPFRYLHIDKSNNNHHAFAVAALRALAIALFEKLVEIRAMEASQAQDLQFVRTMLLEARYRTLRGPRGKASIPPTTATTTTTTTTFVLSKSQQQQVRACISQLVPRFNNLNEIQSEPGVLLLVTCHLLELWAVELVGAAHVAEAWEQALL